MGIRHGIRMRLFHITRRLEPRADLIADLRRCARRNSRRSSSQSSPGCRDHECETWSFPGLFLGTQAHLVSQSHEMTFVGARYNIHLFVVPIERARFWESEIRRQSWRKYWIHIR
ncbi:hypothetical protein BR93DRAFT_665302 [Coniochaeta sp. PMI_546]|nr:hypothetical protein BR93DRAFT_665302 [Coniochaeta sp. PMI_546]